VSTGFEDVSVEERVRDATRAYTDAIEPAPDAWARLRTNIDEPRMRPLPWRRGVVVIGAAIAVAVAIVVLVVVTLPGVDHHRVQTPLRPVPTTTTLAPLVQGPDAASTLLASWGRFHTGYVFVYADGRVIFYPDTAGMWVRPDGRVTAYPDPLGTDPPEEGVVFRHAVFERRLSARGLDLVRAGKLSFGSDLFSGGASNPYRRSKLWAERNAKVWQPSRWAIAVPWFVDATRWLQQLPVPVQDLLDGKQRTCHMHVANAHWMFPWGTEPDERGCFELTAAEFAAFRHIFDPSTSTTDATCDYCNLNTGSFWPSEVDGRPQDLLALPIYPHGEPQEWGG